MSERPYIEKESICKACGKIFTSRNKCGTPNKYCSSLCRKESYKNRAASRREDFSSVIGKTFGHWTILEGRVKNGRSRVLARCVCGEEREVDWFNIKGGTSKSCGCVNRKFKKSGEINEAAPSYKKIIDETGKKYGELTVLRAANEPDLTEAQRKTTGIYWVCQCSCGGTVVCRGNELRKGERVSCGCVLSRGEKLLSEILTEKGVRFEREKSFLGLVGLGGGALRFDFWLPDRSTLIEYDGQQHSEVSFSQSENPEADLVQRQAHDALKNLFCKERGLRLIRIPYTVFSKEGIEEVLEESGVL